VHLVGVARHPVVVWVVLAPCVDGCALAIEEYRIVVIVVVDRVAVVPAEEPFRSS
jgi:hypothetical protein